MGRNGSEACRYCGGKDDPEHTLFRCDRSQEERAKAWMIFGGEVDCHEITERMLESKEAWRAEEKLLAEIMKRKEEKERIFQKDGR